MNIPVILIVIAAGLIVYLYLQLEQTKSNLRKLPEAAKEIDNSIEALEAEVFVLRRALLNVVRGTNETVNKMANAKNKKELETTKNAHNKESVATQTASIYLASIYNTGYTTELLKKIYREHNLPEQFSSELAMISYNTLNGKKWNGEAWEVNNDKYEKMLKRMLKTDFENLQDELDAEEKQLRELNEKYSEYY